MTIYIVINAILMSLGNIVKFPLIYKPTLRFNTCLTVIITAIIFGVDEFAYLPFSPLCDNKPALMVIYILTVLTCIVLIRTDKIIDVLVINGFYQFLYNVIGTAIIAILTVVYGAVSGADISTWFSRSTSTTADFAIRCIATVLAFAVALIICRKCVPLMSNLSKRLKLPLFMGTAVPIFIFMVLRQAIDPDTSQMLAGAMVACYGILLTLMAVSLLVFFINVFLQTREYNQLIQAKIEAQSEHYHRVLKIQQELREAKHDLANRLVAYNISQSAKTDSKK